MLTLKYCWKHASAWVSDMLRGAWLVLLLLLAGCAALKVPPVPLNGFSVSGRVSIRAGNDAHYANFAWQAESSRDRLSLGNPLGQILAELEIHYVNDVPVSAVLRDADGHARTGNAEALLREATGMSLPVSGLRWWLQGVPAPGDARTQFTEDGLQIEQDGWRIQASDFSETTPVRKGPRKIHLTRDDVSVRIAISEWQWQTLPQP